MGRFGQQNFAGAVKRDTALAKAFLFCMHRQFNLGPPAAFLGANDFAGEPRVSIKSALHLHRCHCGHPTVVAEP